MKAPWSFVGNSLFRGGKRGVFGYRLRAGGLVVHTRHTWLDDFVFDEVFGGQVYRPPAAVQTALGSGDGEPRVLDLGGHLGFAALYFLALYPRARVVSYEPEPENARILRRTVAANRRQKQWQVVEAGAGSHSGRADFVAGAGARSHLVDATAVEPVSAEGERIEVAIDDVLPLLAEAELVKLDVEGGEWQILSDERFAASAPAALVLEFHGRDDLQGAAAHLRSLLADAGYTVGEAQMRPELGNGTLWAWREGNAGSGA
ncbi:MAG: FkbM family methyltransferase [Solirubrobacterales bacterium]